jgi:hypothetical protein
MSGGGGGPIIIGKLLETPTNINPIDRVILQDILDRNPVRLTRGDALRVLLILWTYLRN